MAKKRRRKGSVGGIMEYIPQAKPMGNKGDSRGGGTKGGRFPSDGISRLTRVNREMFQEKALRGII